MSATVKILLAIAAVVLAQTAVLTYMVIDRVTLLRTGSEIILPIIPVDPRDLFRGEYVRLSYGISSVLATLVEGPRPQRNEVLYVTVEKNADDEGWHAVRAARTFGSLHPEKHHVVLKGRVLFGSAAAETVNYGIESYFVPQGEGRRLEELARSRKLAVLVAVDKAGNAAIKGLLIDGKLQYEEPLF
jgi:uncharacterized membrane-anchored protein